MDRDRLRAWIVITGGWTALALFFAVSALQHLKQLWHVLVHYGMPARNRLR